MGREADVLCACAEDREAPWELGCPRPTRGLLLVSTHPPRTGWGHPLEGHHLWQGSSLLGKAEPSTATVPSTWVPGVLA